MADVKHCEVIDAPAHPPTGETKPCPSSPNGGELSFGTNIALASTQLSFPPQ